MGSLKQHHFVLVDGGGHGVWCWVKIVPLLEKAGHRVTTLDLIGAGANPLSPNDVTSFKEYNQPLEDLFTSFPGGEKVILVGHSMGSLSFTYLAELFPEKISVAIYLMPSLDLHLFDRMVNEPGFLPPINWEYTFKVEGGPPTAQKFSPASLKEYLYNKCSPEVCNFCTQ